MDFELSREQKMIQKSVREFMHKEIAPLPRRLTAMTASRRASGKSSATWECLDWASPKNTAAAAWT